MPSFENFQKQVKKTTQHLLVKVDELTDEAALQIKKNTQEGRLREAYEVLGKAAYEALLKGEIETEAVKSAALAVEKERDALEDIQNRIDLLKQKRAAK